MSVPPVPSAAPSSSSADSDLEDSGESGQASKKSSYYFFKSTPAHEAHKYMPTLLSPGQSAAAQSPSPIPSPSPSQSPEPAVPSAAGGGSRWNAAGTWEEKDLSSWAHSRLTSLLLFTSSTVPPLDVSCTAVKGDATAVFTRGKKKVGYDLAITCDWKGRARAGGEEVKGALELPSVDQTSDDDFEMTVTVKERGAVGDDEVDQLTRAAKKLRDTITSKIKQFEKELQEQ